MKSEIAKAFVAYTHIIKACDSHHLGRHVGRGINTLLGELTE